MSKIHGDDLLISFLLRRHRRQLARAARGLGRRRARHGGQGAPELRELRRAAGGLVADVLFVPWKSTNGMGELMGFTMGFLL